MERHPDQTNRRKKKKRRRKKETSKKKKTRVPGELGRAVAWRKKREKKDEIDVWRLRKERKTTRRKS